MGEWAGGGGWRLHLLTCSARLLPATIDVLTRQRQHGARGSTTVSDVVTVPGVSVELIGDQLCVCRGRR